MLFDNFRSHSFQFSEELMQQIDGARDRNSVNYWKFQLKALYEIKHSNMQRKNIINRRETFKWNRSGEESFM